MLVLSRQRDESIVIGNEGKIKVMIVDIIGNKVRFGIEAPDEISVHRREVYDAIQRENLRASQLKTSDLGKKVENETPAQIRTEPYQPGRGEY
jgi:carbon storage regulator